MAYFVFFALVVAFLSSTYATEVTYTQVPNPVSFGGNVTVTSTVADSKFKTMECWLPNGTDVRKLTHGHGVKSANSGNNETTTSAIISLDLAKFPSERTFSCGLDKNASQSYTICVSWNIVRPPLNITVHKADIAEGSSITMSCALVEDCTPSPNPWFDRNGMQVVNDTTKEITVSHELVEGTKGTVVEWKLTFANLTLGGIYSNYTCRASPSIAVTAKVEKADDDHTDTPQDQGAESDTSILSSSPPSPATTVSVDPMTTTGSDKSSSPLPSPSLSSAIELDENFMTESGTSVPNNPPPEPTTTKDPTTTTGVDKSSSPSPTPSGSSDTGEPSTGHQPVGIAAVAVAIVVVVIISGVVFMVYWKRHMLRDWLMDKDVVKVMKKGKKGKGYKYSKLPKDVSTSMKHLE